VTFNLCKNTLGKCDLGVVGYVSHHGWLGNREIVFIEWKSVEKSP
jgi:hypothetical protein